MSWGFAPPGNGGDGPSNDVGRTSAGGKASPSGVHVNADTTGIGEGRVHPENSLFARRTARPWFIDKPLTGLGQALLEALDDLDRPGIDRPQ